MTGEKRRILRVEFAGLVKATLEDVAVKLVDLSTTGARVEHRPPMKARQAVNLKFYYQGELVTLDCVVVRSCLQRSVTEKGAITYQSGLRFSNPNERSRATVREIVAAMSTKQTKVVDEEALVSA